MFSILGQARNDIIKILKKTGVNVTPVDIVFPPNANMGDLALPLFALAKEREMAPAALAQELVKKLKPLGLVERIEAAGPYLNFFLHTGKFTQTLFGTLQKEKEGYGQIKTGKGKKYLVEFSCANPMKSFHLGHLRNTITGESVCRILENAGYRVVRVNYQGDVGMHIAKSLWGIARHHKDWDAVLDKTLEEQIAFLGQAYAYGAQAFEAEEEAKKEILELNRKIYTQDESTKEIYTIARAWSLEKFELIYERLDTRFDEFYFESEVWERGLEITKEFFKKGVFKKGDGAIIFPGEEHDLHDRVFITTEGNPTYEAKDLALSERRHAKHHPDKIIHVVGKEQTEYFKVVFKALEYTLPKSKGKEYHLPGGFLQLKEGKMSSRTGHVVLAETLLDKAEVAVIKIMKDHAVKNKKQVIKVVADAAVKYAILRNHVSADVLFDMKESVSLSGDSGPYLLYIVARINSILRKSGNPSQPPLNPHPTLSLPSPLGRGHWVRAREWVWERGAEGGVRGKTGGVMSNPERSLIMSLARFPEITKEAAQEYDPSRIAHYLFDVAQKFNAFYQDCPVLQAEDLNVRAFRLQLIAAVTTIMTRGLFLLGIQTVEEM